MTDVEQAPPQNGIDTLAGDDKDNNAERPADIQQDMREMERRKRVEAIMGSKLFREELERIVDSAREGGGTSGILQQLSDIVGIPVSRVGGAYKAHNCMLPINDIRGVEAMGYAKGEKILRCKLAATFRLLDIFGWSQGGLGAQITARLKVDQEYFLVNPYGLMYHEITASSLNKVDMQGLVVEQGTTNFGVNRNHFALHSAVHAARPDIRCVIYIGCSPVVAISSLRTGLLPLTKDACVLGEITTHPYSGALLDAEERDRLVRNLGPNSKVILLSNHGALCCGETIEEAFYAACHIVQACETQLKLLPVGLDNLVLIPEETRKTIYEQARRPPEDLEKHFAAALTIAEEEAGKEAAPTKEKVLGSTPKWRVGGAEFEGLMRMLDNAGYRTGYIYRHPLIKSEPPKPKSDVELPPAVSSLGYLLEEEELYRQGIWKKGDLRKGGDRSRWLNSPNVYQKVEVLETGTPDPKKITKWVADGSPTHSTPVRIEDALQFVPTGTSTKEFKRLQQQIKDNRRADKISAGPQSHILEGVTWDEANRLKEGNVSASGDHVVLMGAASKGIIQRGFQHNAAVYKAPYAKNPFDNVTDDELNEYKRTVERKKKSIHGEYTDTDFSESEPLSSLQTSGGQKQTTTTTTAAAVSHSEPEDAEHQVLRIQTQQAPVPSQAEVVMSDANNINKQNGKDVADAAVLEDVDDEQKVAADDKEDEAYYNKYLFYIEKSKQLENMKLMNEMRNTALFKQQVEKIDKLASNEVKQVESGNSRAIDTQRNLNIQEPLPQLLFPTIKRAHGRQRIDIDNNQNEPLYEVTQGSQYMQSDNCKRPQSCNAIFQSLLNTNELDAKLLANLPWSTASTPCMNTPRNIRYREVARYVSQLHQPYRTVSHFGFNSPTRLPQPEHKHIPLSAPRSATLAAAYSYDDVYGSPRYVDLCHQCYEQLLRLKTDFIPVRTRLCNLVDLPKSSGTAETTTETLIYEAPVANEPAVLETVLEVDENKTSDVSVCVEPVKNDEEMQAQNTQLQSTFERRISSFNFSKESTNIHYEPPLIADSVLSVGIQSFNENALEPVEEQATQIVDESKCKVEILEVIEFGNWMKADGVQECQYRSSDELQVANIKSPKVLEHSSDAESDVKMTRDERLERKKEFQEIWEDHINFFTGKETAMLEEVKTEEKAECPIEEVYRSSSENDEKEVFLGCSLIVHNIKTVPIGETLLALQAQQMARQSTPFFLAADIQVPGTDHTLSGHNDTLDLVESEPSIETCNQEEFLSNVSSEQSFYDHENAEDASDECSLNSVDCEILEKIELYNLKQESEIFEKIEHAVRNKLTPRRLRELLKKEQENYVAEEAPTTSAQALCNLKKHLGNAEQTNELNLEKEEKLNLISSSSTFSIASNKEEEEEVATEVEQKSKANNSSNTSILSRQFRGKRTKRNFIRENIKNASKPRILKGTPSKFNENPSAVFCPSPFGEQPMEKKRKKQESSSSNSSLESALYIFQKQQKESGVQSLWMSMSSTSASKRKSSTNDSVNSANSIRRKLFTEKQMKRRQKNTAVCSSSILKLSPLRGIGIKPLPNYATKVAAKIVELEQHSDKENMVDSVESQDNNHYYTAENEKAVEDEVVEKSAAMSLEELASNICSDESAREAILNDYIQELLSELEESDEQ